MNKTAIKNFAVWARNKLRSEIAYKARLVGITEKCIAEPLPQSTEDLQIFDIGTSKPVSLEGKTAIEQRNSLVSAIKSKHLKHEEAFDIVIEEVAYTWFNRLIAVRFMEVNDYLPSGLRVLSSADHDKAEPDFVTSPFETDLAFTSDEMDYIDECKDKSRLDELFQFLFIRQCNTLHNILPELFEKTNDYTELLLNVSFTDKDGIIWHLVHDIPEDDFNIEKQGQVEIIGWLYQYYNTEPKAKVFSRPSGQKIRKEDVPAATQLFTPDWIVRYMVENSLGRTWTDIKPDSDLKNEWKYYLPEAEQSEEVQAKLLEMRQAKSQTSPEEITFLDPCMGSGHILVYAFDVLMAIYTSQGYIERDAAQRIVEKNLYGLEIDNRAAQLAYFAVMMKARFYDRRFFKRKVSPNVCAIQESNHIKPEFLSLFGDLQATAQKLCNEFKDAKEYGSILNLKITAEEISRLEEKFAEIKSTDYDNISDIEKQAEICTYFAPLIRQAKIMIKKYDVVCTNPPYMGGGFSPKLDEYIKKQYSDSKSDLFAVFIEKCGYFAKSAGYYAMITQHAWMFLSSYEKLRKKLQLKTTVNMAHLGARAFDEISGEVVQTTAFVNLNQHITNYLGTYARLIDGKSENEKSTMLLSGKYNYTANADNFSKIPGSPVAYWVSDTIFTLFSNEKKVFNYGKGVKGLDTGNDNYFLKLWWEIDRTNENWRSFCKGGSFRKWYGNKYYVIQWANDGYEVKNYKDKNGFPLSYVRNRELYFTKGLEWSRIASDSFGVRLMTDSCFGGGSQAAFIKNDSNFNYIFALLNTKISLFFIRMINPTLVTQAGTVNSIPMILKDINIDGIVAENTTLCKEDWDLFETSWDFKKHPLIPMSEYDGNIFLAIKVSEKKWIEGLRNGNACFSPTHFFIEQSERTGNDEQGDKFEGVFARLKKGDKRINNYICNLKDDLEIIDDGEYVRLRRISSKDIPIFCVYGVNEQNFDIIEEMLPDENGERRYKSMLNISSKMYKDFLTENDDVWGMYASPEHLFNSIEESLRENGIAFRKVIVDYDRFSNDEYCLELNEKYNELDHKIPKFKYQQEVRYILYNIHQQERMIINYKPLSEKSCGIAQNELRCEAVIKAEKKSGQKVEDIFAKWEAECEARFQKLKQNEEELNRIFIDIYGLQDELTPEVADKDVTVRKADLTREIKSLISYAVGCMFGRYSIYKDGLLFAGEKYSLQGFVDKLNSREGTVSAEEINRAYHNEGVVINEMFYPCDDNCIPITDTRYFEDDIVSRFAEFIKVVYGADTLEENLDFIANALGNKGNSSREIIRNYFLNDFFKDHCKIYQKRPIYWLFDSGKQNGFKALIYIHRYNADTIGNLRVEYLHKVQRIYESEINREQDTIENTKNPREKKASENRKEKLQRQLKETKEYDAKIAHIALSRIEIDLDDGIKVNYDKVQTSRDGKKLEILAKI